MSFHNSEIKAVCHDADKIRSVLIAEGADYKGLDHQIDTYFNVSRGRLKLREGTIENYLIFYERDERAGVKDSQVELYATKPNSNIKTLLSKSLGVLVVVDKKREIYFIDNVKFHIDDVKDLGSFVEIEAQDMDGSLGSEKITQQCKNYIKLFNIVDADMVSGSYSDLLIRK